MNQQGERTALSHIVHSPPVLGPHWDPGQSNHGAGSAFVAKSYLGALYDGRRTIIAITALLTLAAISYALVASPVYEANLLIHIEDDSPNASENVLGKTPSASGTKSPALAEMALLRSRMVVAGAVDNLRSFIDVRPHYFPIAAFWFASQRGGVLSRPGLFGYGGYVWSSERADVSLFNVPDNWLNREFTLTAEGQHRYRLSGGGQRFVFDGLVGERYLAQTPDGPLEIRVDQLQANPGASFHMQRRSRLATIATIQNALVVTEQGKQSGVIGVTLQGDNAGRISALLGEIGREYMHQHTVREAEASEKSLAFMNRQLTVLKRQVEESEERYDQFRTAHGTVDLHAEASMSLQQAAAARGRRSDLLQKRNELLARFTDDHPIVAALNRQRKDVDAEIDEIAARIKTLPALEQEDARLAREKKANTDLYNALSTTAQQLRMLSASRVSNVRVIDTPVTPETPIGPNRVSIVVAAMLTGLILGSAAVLARKAFSGGIDDPLKIERLLRARVVYATIPHSVNQDKLARNASGNGWAKPLLAQLAPDDPAIESLRSLRAALQFSLPHFKNNMVMFAGPTAGIGKSFIAANFAAVVAASGKRVLLIDADLRNGQLHRYFGVPRETGLSTAICGAIQVGEAIHHDVIDRLDFVATGKLPPNCSELLLHLNLANFLETVSAQYDLVLIDPPSILAVADSLVIGAHAGSVFIVARSGVTTINEIHESIKQLNQAGISPQGVLFNDMAIRLQFTAAYSWHGEHKRLALAE